MTHDFRSETFELSTDNHLADRAKLGSAPAFDELVHRHADTAIATAMVVTGDARSAVAVGARAFTDVLDQMATGGYSIDDPYLPGLIRSSRELALSDEAADPALRERMDTRLPELARSTRWLTTVVALDREDLALALDVEDPSVPGILAWTEAVLAEHAAAVDTVLGGVRVLIPTAFAADARSIWRRWLATAGIESPIGTAGGGLAIESVTSRILRGAAVLLIVGGAIGAAAGIAQRGNDGAGPTRVAQRAAVEQPADRVPGGSSALNGFGSSGAQQALAGTGTGALVPAWMSTNATTGSPMSDLQQVRVLAASDHPGSSWMWNRAKAAMTGTASPTRSTRTTVGSAPAAPQSPSSSAPWTSSGPAQPAAPTPSNGTPTSPSGPATGTTTPGMPGIAGMPPATVPSSPLPPVTPPVAPSPPVTAAPVTLPPVKVPPVALPPITVPTVLAPAVGSVTGAVGSLLGGGR